MFRKLDDFLHAYEEERAGTLRLFESLTDASLSQAVAPGHRDLGRLAWHIVQSVPEMMNRLGLGLDHAVLDAGVPATAAAIAPAYRRLTGELIEKLRAGWTDETLLTVDDMYGETWARGRTLMVLLVHEVHHRGQLTVLMRQAGVPVKGVYGPSRDEWGQYGAEPPTV